MPVLASSYVKTKDLFQNSKVSFLSLSPKGCQCLELVEKPQEGFDEHLKVRGR